jgi:hypothetical protein
MTFHDLFTLHFDPRVEAAKYHASGGQQVWHSRRYSRGQDFGDAGVVVGFAVPTRAPDSSLRQKRNGSNLVAIIFRSFRSKAYCRSADRHALMAVFPRSRCPRKPGSNIEY